MGRESTHWYFHACSTFLDLPIIVVASLAFFFLHNFSSTSTSSPRCIPAEPTTYFSSALLFLSSGFSPRHSPPYSSYPLASAAIEQFKLLLTGSAGDLWLHLSPTWNPPPWGLAHVILVPLPSSRTFHPSFLCLTLPRSLPSPQQYMFSSAVCFICFFLYFHSVFCFFLPRLMPASSFFLSLQNKLRTGG